tara:strand:+ start:583 stop:1089 length:507 start_codon:yes stop_codon:yes gene_type:complete
MNNFDDMNQKEDLNYILDIELVQSSLLRKLPEVEHEREVAIFDLLEKNKFKLNGDNISIGPYKLRLSFKDGNITFLVSNKDNEFIKNVILSIKPFRRLIKDYFLVCESYYDAIKTMSPKQIEAIDMGRRSLHNEGAEILKDRMSKHVEIDSSTARRFFTLLCVLQIRG